MFNGGTPEIAKVKKWQVIGEAIFSFKMLFNSCPDQGSYIALRVKPS